MYYQMHKRTLAKLNQAEKNGLPAHDSACIRSWIKRAEFEREYAKDKTIRLASIRRNFYKGALQRLLFAQDLLRSFELTKR